MSNSIKMYTQNNCPYCTIMKDKLDSWCMNYDIVNVSEDLSSKKFLKERGHRTVTMETYILTKLTPLTSPKKFYSKK